MEAAIESRLTALEERLGLPPYDGSKPDTVLDVFSLKKKINELGYGFIFKIQPDVLKKCCNIGEEPQYATFGQKRAGIEFGYDLMMERIRLLEQFQKNAEVRPFVKHSEDIHKLKQNFCELVEELKMQLKEFEELVKKAEQDKVAKEAS
ncbi:unnamed protein product [Enterobius vermicularis]|uniref:V-type proton ATPase subunit a n=1 Tax=Enterobius vermicularis TaxID=51028 RepID=A0A0N4UZ66_ENTVE|nr:unnamed protein product [Enterobius vermicularis]